MDTNPQQPQPGSWPNLQNQNSQQKPPPPPPPEITLRTMQSDLESVKQTGGTATSAPKPFTPPELKEMASTPTPTVPKTSPASFPSQAQKTVTPGQFSVNEELPKISASAKMIAPIQRNMSRTLFIILGIVVIAIAFAALGYFYVFPKFFTTAPAPITTDIEPSQGISITPPVTAPPTSQTPTRTIFTHLSLLIANDGSSETLLADMSLASIKKALVEEAKKVASPGALTEVVFKDALGPISASQIFAALLPDIAATSLTDDFTLAFYFDASGAWPTYIVKFKSAADAMQFKSALENSSRLNNLFATDAGISSGGFKDGQANGKATRYLTFTQKGAAINTFQSGSTAVISTSYNAIKKVLSNLK